ncbi:cation diffusion facilitator family transporter [Massilia sp. LjRoot122]|uniref:cation diffusion facilitator family transporter n=1 Tax=Massilia sp. LjRoot122 TaxID=3342257 RepID=UPI003ECDC2B8
MGDRHTHGTRHGSGNLKVAFLLNFTFTIIELIGGLWTNSVSILSDAVHDLGDSISLGLAWYFDRLSKRGSTPGNTYGYARYSLLGGLITAVVLVAGIGFILWQATQRLIEPEDVDTTGMIVIAVIGVIFNGAAVLRVRKGSSLTEKVVSWHLLEDTLGWIAVLIGAAVMAVWDLPWIDPALSIAISLFVLWNVFRNLRKILKVFMQRTPTDFDVGAFESAAKAIPGVVDIHDTRSWSIDGESHVLTTHLVVKTDAPADRVQSIREQVAACIGNDAFGDVTIEIEYGLTR